MRIFNLVKIPWPYLALIIAHIIWGVVAVVGKLTLQEFPVMSLSFLRFAFASLLLTPFFFNIDRSKIKIKPQDLPRLILASLLMVPITIALGYEGLKNTSAIHASVLSLVIPISSIIISWLFLKEHIYFINLIGSLLGIIGAGIILGFHLLFFGNFSAENLTGDLLVMLSGVTFVAGTVISKDLLAKYTPLVLTGAAFLIGTVAFILPTANEYFQNPNWISNVSIVGVLGFLYISILSSVVAFFLMEWALKKTDVVKANLFQYVEPAVTATVAVPLLGERISFSFIIGTVLIVLGVYWGTLGKPHHHHLIHRHHRS